VCLKLLDIILIAKLKKVATIIGIIGINKHKTIFVIKNKVFVFTFIEYIMHAGISIINVAKTLIILSINILLPIIALVLTGKDIKKS
jgi:hypothetical protein